MNSGMGPAKILPHVRYESGASTSATPRDRHHDPIFWRTLGGIMPDWRERKALLEAWEREIGHEAMRLG